MAKLNSGTRIYGNVTIDTFVTATGNVTGGNILTVGVISATGNIAGNFFIGNGSQLTGIAGGSSYGNANVVANLAALGSNPVSTTGNITGGNVLGGANVNATTHTGTTVSVTGNITGGNVLGGANVNATTHTGTTVSVTGNITGGNVLGGANVNATTHTGTTVSVTSTVTGSQFNGSGAGLTSIPAANVSGTVANATYATSAGSATTAGTVTTAAQPNITSVGTLTGLTINNATTAITNGAANGVGNIGTSANSFNTIFAKATSAQYADLAEMYVADADYLPGTVLEFGGKHEVTVSNSAGSVLIAGVVSTNPAHLMNSTAQGEYLAAIALVGRVPTLVVGPVFKGAMMVSAGNGYAQASATPAMGTVIGKAVEDFTGASGTIEIAVGRL